MHHVLRTFRPRRWGRVLSVLLVGVLMMQGPVQGLLQAAHEAWGTHSCAHTHHNVCPRNPDGPCTCAHSDPVDPEAEGPFLQACHGGSDAEGPVPVPRWQPVSSPALVPKPHMAALTLSAPPAAPPPQRYGDDILRPPRTTPPVRLI
jgi:hypothetical protein